MVFGRSAFPRASQRVSRGLSGYPRQLPRTARGLQTRVSRQTPQAMKFGLPKPEALARNVAGLQIVREIRAPTMPIARAYAERNKLEIDWSNPAATVSKLAVITQTPKEFDHSRFRKRRRADQESCCLPREILRMRHRQRLSQARPKSVCESAMFSGRTSLNRIAPKRKIFPIRM
jgi:hypothetical protein